MLRDSGGSFLRRVNQICSLVAAKSTYTYDIFGLRFVSWKAETIYAAHTDRQVIDPGFVIYFFSGQIDSCDLCDLYDL